MAIVLIQMFQLLVYCETLNPISLEMQYDRILMQKEASDDKTLFIYTFNFYFYLLAGGGLCPPAPDTNIKNISNANALLLIGPILPWFESSQKLR